jgi:hypothetical protein
MCGITTSFTRTGMTTLFRPNAYSISNRTLSAGSSSLPRPDPALCGDPLASDQDEHEGTRSNGGPHRLDEVDSALDRVDVHEHLVVREVRSAPAAPVSHRATSTAVQMSNRQAAVCGQRMTCSRRNDVHGGHTDSLRSSHRSRRARLGRATRASRFPRWATTRAPRRGMSRRRRQSFRPRSSARWVSAADPGRRAVRGRRQHLR